METFQNDSDEKKELDDSGCVQDASSPSTNPVEEEPQRPNLLDLSDDVLLDILKYCAPRDLKALGFSCPRLGMLICDRSLWRRVDARGQPTGRARMRWLLAHTLGPTTTELLLSGYAKEAVGCLGHVNRKRLEVEEEQAMKDKQDDAKVTQSAATASTASTSASGGAGDAPVQPVQPSPLSRLQRLYSQQLPGFNGIPLWPEPEHSEVDPEDVVLLDGSCPGPVFTLTQCMLRQLRMHCSLTALALDYCNVNCNNTGINHFPPTLKWLSLRGAKCYNLPLDKSFLFNIQDYLPHLEHLDLSECEWLEPASFLPLSKVPKLTHLTMRDCYRLSEFVAYASLATRYGFRRLKMLDVRGSPVGDSEVSALGWLPRLEELYVAPAAGPPPRPTDHSHCRDERLPPHSELEPWEVQEPDYFKIKPQMVESIDTHGTASIDDIEEHIERLRNYENNICLHGMEYNLCTEGMRPPTRPRRHEQLDEAEKSTPVPDDTDDLTAKTPEPQEPSVLIKKCDDNRVLFKRIQPGSPPQKKMDVETDTVTFKKAIEPSSSTKRKPANDYDEAPLKKRTLKNEPSCSKAKDEPSTSSRYTVKKQTEDEDDASLKNKQFKDDDNDASMKKKTQINEPSCSKAKDEPSTSSTSAKKQTDDNDDGPLKTRSPKDDDDDDAALKKITLKGETSYSKSKDEPSTSSKNSGSSEDKDKPSTSSDTTKSKPSQSDSDSNNSDDDIPLKSLCGNTVNEGASTSKSPTKPPESPKKPENVNCVRPDSHPSGCRCKDNSFEYVHFSQNMKPVVVRRHEMEQHVIARERVSNNLEQIDREEREEEEERDRQRETEAPGQQREARPRAHILYVNVGQQLHTVYRLSVHNEPPIFYSFARNSHLRFRPNVGNIFYTPPTPLLDSTALVTDAAVRRFGRADVDDSNYVHIGPNRQAVGESGSRPNRSSLRILSVTGFRNVTNRSLVHLATAAPNLTLIDFTGTRVTAQGVENFRCHRPDCEVRFSPEGVHLANVEPADEESADEEPVNEEPVNDDPDNYLADNYDEPGDGDDQSYGEDGNDTDEGEDAD